jgi:hypothetical protein
MDGEIVATPLMNIGQPFGATWTGMPGEPGDWVGLYSVGAPDTNPWLWIHGEDDAYTWLLPGVFPAGDYEFRMFDDYSFERIGTSNTVHLQDPSQPFVMVDDAPIDTRQIVHDYSNVTWAEGAPGTDAFYFDGVSFAAGEVNYVTTTPQGPLPYGGSIQMTLELTGGPIVWSDWLDDQRRRARLHSEGRGRLDRQRGAQRLAGMVARGRRSNGHHRGAGDDHGSIDRE